MINLTTALANWIPQVAGRYLNEDWNPTNQGFGAQCWDVPANWAKYLGLPVISTNGKGRWPGWAGNMSDAFPQSAAIAAAYELLPPTATVRGGDTLVWDDSYPAWFPKTHVAVAVRDLGAQLLCISQNSSAPQPGNPYPQWTTGPTILQHLPRRGLLGIIRPRTGINPQGITTPSEEDEMSAAGEKAILDLLTGMNEKLDAAATGDQFGTEFEKKVNIKVDELVGNAQKTFWNSEEAKIRMQNMDPAEFAASVPEDQAQKFVDALAERLGGK
ncbi:hypothetical protein [Arthrobacter sp. UYCu712]|uniref:hypothetical protein n=1 Tax=Arthrobacter sp. UYCu712 TaxID=3156340 RepID=UPI00339A8F5C